MTITLNEAKQRWKPVYQDGSTVAMDLAQEIRGLIQRRFDGDMPVRALPSLEQHLRAWLRNETMAAAEDDATAAFLDALLAAEVQAAPSLEEALEEVAS